MPESRKPSRGLVRRAPRALMSVLAGAGAPEVHPGVATAVTGARAATAMDESAGAVAATGATGPARLAAALGLAAAGERATARLEGAELSDAAELLAEAARRRLSLVVQWRSGEGGHEPLARVLGSGAVVLVAADAQEVADLTLVARRVAEEGLAPVLVAQDGSETADSLQDVLLPDPVRVGRWLGAAGERVHPPTRAQELLFGRHRRRMVRWHDPERPMASGVALDPATAALAAAGRRAYLDEALPGLLERAFDDFARETGRRYEALSARGAETATLVLVALGAAAGTAGAATDALRDDGAPVGAVGLRCLAPFPSAHLADLLRTVPGVAVIEALGAPLADEGPLARQVRAAVASCQEAAGPSETGGRRSLAAEVRAALSGTEGGGPPRRPRRVVGPAVASVLVPGPLRGADVAALCRELLSGWRTPIHLGVAFGGDVARGRYPKREVLQDALTSSYPDAGAFGLRGRVSAPDLRPAGALSVALHGDLGRDGVAVEAAALLHRTLGGRVRTRAGRLLWAPAADRRLAEPGPDAPIDLAVWLGPGAPGPELVASLAPGASLLIPSASGASLQDWWTALSSEVREAVSTHGVDLYTVERDSDDASEVLLGALLALLQKEGKVAFKPRKALDARRERLTSPDLGPALDPAVLDRRLASFQAGLDRVRALSAAELAVRRTPPPEADPVPPAVRRSVPTAAETVDGLARFWDQVGVLESRGEGDLLTPDPYLATGTLPALSGALRDATDARETLPHFDPSACTGCGACWVSCPHGAVEPVALGAAALLDHGMAAAKRKGASTDALRMAVGKLAAAVTAELTASGGGPAGPILDAAYQKAAAKLPLPEERKAAVADAFAAVRAELADLPLAATEPFGDSALLLALDPDRCTGCGICVAACEPEALSAAADTPARTRDARRLSRELQEMPETPAGTVESVRSHPEVDSLAAALLPRSARRVAAAGDAAEPGSGEALAVRQVLGAAAHHSEPLRRRRAEGLRELAEELAGAIHGDLATALPDRDLDAMAKGLEVLESPASDLAELTGRINAVLTEEREEGRVDLARLRRLVDVARDVADLRLRTGAAAPFGLVLAGGPAAWGASFPFQPFAVPATVAPPHAAAAVARGLAEGACREAVAGARRVRRARKFLGAVTPSEAARAEGEVRDLARLTWSDLDPAERLLATPVFVVASEEALASDLTGLVGLLSSDLPVKVLAVTPTAAPSALADLLLAWACAGSLPSAVLAQTTVGHGARIEATVAAALVAPADGDEPEAVETAFRPALLRVLAPLPSAGGFAPERTLERAREAVADRTYPLFLRSPREGGILTLDLAGNPPAGADTEVSAAWRALSLAAGSEEAFAAAAVVEEARHDREEAERRHRQEVETLRAGYEARIREIESGARVALAREVRARLLALATKGLGGLERPATPNGEAEAAPPEPPASAPEGN